MVCIALLWAFLLFPCVAPVACLPSTIEISPTAARVLLPWGLSSSASVGSSLALCPSLPATPAIGKPPLSPRPRPPLARLGALRPRTAVRPWSTFFWAGIGASWRIHPTRSGRQLPVPETWRNHPTTMPDGSSAASPHPRRDLVNPSLKSLTEAKLLSRANLPHTMCSCGERVLLMFELHLFMLADVHVTTLHFSDFRRFM
ncbi:uncharacterized protein [Triticum aestivum]|uniref:uncharacterized protein isoform X4 n=1 Tax=Triticum aestivum TaxID=4565 RepID=UPI001D034F41|nr:uncharacterized protein LOC123052830 isoform X4 [Triticum aestivum]